MLNTTSCSQKLGHLWPSSSYLMALSYQKLPLSVAEPIWAALGIIAATLLGQFVYHERVALAQWLGVFLIIVGVLLVSFNNSN
ncbi:hypothetical protein EFM24_01285 [Limosilactobacillus fermentum]|nr:hypothetical protein [Limosilactobacillus fermentum]RGW58439.1 hypothetical protein DWV65_00955 [Limosilactobacillus fermentum]